MPSNFEGLVPSYMWDCTCEECGAYAMYNEYILAEGYPDAHTEYEVICPSCGYTASSNGE